MHLLRFKMIKRLLVPLCMVGILCVIYWRKQRICEFQKQHLVSLTNSALFYFGQGGINYKPIINPAI